MKTHQKNKSQVVTGITQFKKLILEIQCHHKLTPDRTKTRKFLQKDVKTKVFSSLMRFFITTTTLSSYLKNLMCSEHGTNLIKKLLVTVDGSKDTILILLWCKTMLIK